MNYGNRVFMAFVVFIISYSCSYKLVRNEAANDEKYWYRSYKDYEKQTAYNDESFFLLKLRDSVNDNYSGVIRPDTLQDAIFIQYDTVSIFLFGNAIKYKKIFISGLLSNYSFYCLKNPDCLPPSSTIKTINVENGKEIKSNFMGWSGPFLSINYFEELTFKKRKTTQKRFKLHVCFSQSMYIGDLIYLLEVTNNEADKNTDLETFIKGAKVTLLIHSGTMI